MRSRYLTIAGVVLLLGSVAIWAALARQRQKEPPTPGPMLEQGYLDLDTPAFSLRLVRSSQTIAALKPKGAGDFDFTPGDLLIERSKDGFYHLGDFDLRLRQGASSEWRSFSTTLARKPVAALPTSAQILASADLAPTLPTDIPLQITRTWAVEDGKLALRFTLKNKTAESVQIGALGIPMIFNNVLNDRSLDQAHAICSFYDPYIGEDAGYLQVTRLSGHGPALLVVPDGKTPFEAYNPILGARRSTGATIFRDLTPRGIAFEGFYDWMVHSAAFAENEWKKAKPWNPATQVTLASGESKTYGMRFVLADSIRHIEKTLQENRRPVAVGIPGYVLPMDTNGELFLNYPEPVTSATVEPAGAITIKEEAGAGATGFKKYSVHGLARNYDGLVTNHPWDWYLTNAYETSLAMVKLAPGYAVFGQMEGDIFLQLLEDLRREGWSAQADDLEAKMRARTNRWKQEAYPYGSEMPWDSTGQEEVYAWMKHFGFQEKADVTLDAILGCVRRPVAYAGCGTV